MASRRELRLARLQALSKPRIALDTHNAQPSVIADATNVGKALAIIALHVESALRASLRIRGRLERPLRRRSLAKEDLGGHAEATADVDEILGAARQASEGVADGLVGDDGPLKGARGDEEGGEEET